MTRCQGSMACGFHCETEKRDTGINIHALGKDKMGERKSTVLVIVPSLGIGGRERIAVNTVLAFERLGYHPILIIFQRRESEYPFQGEIINIHVPSSESKAGKFISQMKRSLKILRLRKKYDAKYSYSLGEAANISNALSGVTHHGKTIVAIHGFEELKNHPVQRLIFFKADRVVCIAQDMRHHLLSLFPQLKNVVVIENGYSLAAMEHKSNEVSRFPRLVTMGRLTHVKGFDRLIRSMTMIRHRIPDTTLTIMGSGKLEDELRALAQQLELENAVNFIGYAAEPFDILQKHDIYLLTSYAEGFPNALIEALNCGLPIVAADCRSGPREILSAAYTPEPVRGIEHEKYGVLVEDSADGFEERFAEAVLQLWNNKNEMAYYRETAPQRARDFSLERYQEKLKKLLDDCGYESTQ